MITETDNLQERNDDRATLTWSLLVSGVVNLLAWMLVAWSVALRIQASSVAQQRPEETFMVASSSIHIAQRSHPVPQQPNPQPAVGDRAQQSKPSATTKRQEQRQPQAQPTEIARIVPSAPPQPRVAPKQQNAGTLAEKLAQQQVAFEHETQALNAQRAPLSAATIDPAQRESATRTYKMNFSGNPELQGKGEGYYVPLSRFINSDGEHCYYVQYQWIYPTGGTEIGNVPWPFCYPASQDVIARGIRQIPFLDPPPGYRLPSGVYLYPIERTIYNYWLAHQ